MKAIPRKNWLPGDSHRVCIKHFNVDDYKITSRDIQMSRRNSRDRQILQRQRLQLNAVPRIFPNLPAYLSSTPITFRPNSCSSSCARLELENAKLQSLNKAILLGDNIPNCNALKEKSSAKALPKRFLVHKV